MEEVLMLAWVIITSPEAASVKLRAPVQNTSQKMMIRQAPERSVRIFNLGTA
jgi:hypothetical protein